MIPYHFARNTKVVIAPAVADMTAPTVAEIAAGTDIGSDLLIGGIELVRSQIEIPVEPWHGPFHGSRLGAYRIDGAALSGRRSRQGSSEVLWDLAVFRSRGFLIVRTGIRHTVAWTVGDDVEVFDFRFGKRTMTPNDGAATYTVPIAISAEEDAAVVAA